MVVFTLEAFESINRIENELWWSNWRFKDRISKMMWKHERNMSTISQEMHCLGLFANHRKDIKFLRTVLGIQDPREDDGPKKIWWFWRFRRCFLSCPSRDEVECNSFFLFSTQSISFSHEMGDEVGLSSQNKSTCPSNVCVNHLKYPFSCTDGELGRQRWRDIAIASYFERVKNWTLLSSTVMKTMSQI